MMSVFETALKEKQWTLEMQVEVLLLYIERQDSDDAFHDFLQEQPDAAEWPK
jgi:hypothetical protein